MSWSAPTAVGPIRGTVVVPGSKSETNRALLIAALADGPSAITGWLDSRDSRLMIAGLTQLGAHIELTSDALQVQPMTAISGDVEIDCGLAGTVMRFLPPLALLAGGPVRFVGDPHAAARPMAPLLAALRQLGAEVSASAIPVTVTPGGEVGNACELDASSSSQFISGPLLAAARLPRGLTIRHQGPALPSRPHIDMTVEMLRQRGVGVAQPDENTWVVAPGPIQAQPVSIAPDLTNAAAFLAAGLITGGEVSVPNWPAQTNQPGVAFLDIARQMGARVSTHGGTCVVAGPDRLVAGNFDLSGASELTPVVAACAAFAEGTTTICGVAHIRGHETDRLAALKTELSAAGAVATETADGLQITGGHQLRARTFATYADHRMAHTAALIGLRVPGTDLDDVSVTSKTMPDFADRWQALCAT